MKKIMLFPFLVLIVTSFVYAETNETGVDVNFSYIITDNTIQLTDLSTITDTNPNAVWDIFWQVDVDSNVQMVSYHAQQPSDSIFKYTYPQAGTYRVTLYYQKWYLPSNGNPGSNGGQITKSVDITISIPICVNPTFNTVYNGSNNYTFTNTSPLSTDTGYVTAYMWTCSDNSTSQDENVFEHTFADTGVYYIHLIKLASVNDSVICETVKTDTIQVHELSTGINELNSNEDVKLYWNGSNLVIEPRDEIKAVTVFNLLGEQINYNKGLNTDVYIAIAEMKNGNVIIKKVFLNK